MIVVSELLNDAIRTGFLFCMGIAMVRITWWSELARFTLARDQRFQFIPIYSDLVLAN